jgi:DNA-binding MarR family transcriptional regulator
MDRDRLDLLVEQWRTERPDVDPSVMASVGRLLAVAAEIDRRLSRAAAEHGLDRGQADVLFTLRRSGSPYRLSPSQLAASLLITTGAMTNRLDRLEARGLVKRSANPQDRRGMDVQLTREGIRLVDQVLPQHIEHEEAMLSPLGNDERLRLDRALRKLLRGLGRSVDDPA